MLARRSRLRSSQDIDAVVRRGRRHPTPPLMVWALKKSQGPFRLAVLCSKKVDKRATGRNKIKRRIREAVRTTLPHHLPTFDLVVSVKPAAKNLTTSDFREIFCNVFHI